MRPDQIERYSRQILLPEVGAGGQARLRGSSVLLVGAGGLGAPLALYLVAAGVGRIGIVDGDRVERSNLGRQVLFDTADIGRPKVEAARERLLALNPETEVEVHSRFLDAELARGLVDAYDVVADAVDDTATRYLLNDACLAWGRPLVEAGVTGWEGWILTILPDRGPCLRCLFPEDGEEAPTCSQTGVLGPVVGMVGSAQATEVLRLLLGLPPLFAGNLWSADLAQGRFRQLAGQEEPKCPCHRLRRGRGDGTPLDE